MRSILRYWCLDFESCADDNTSYSCLSDMVSVLGQLKGGIDKTFD